MESKTEIRQRMRRRRRRLGLRERSHAARRVAAALHCSPLYRHCRRIACYWASDGEMDLKAFLLRAYREGREIYLPVLKRGPAQQLRFHRYRPGERLRRNRFGIPEPRPRPSTRISCRLLDLVLAPLVAFDSQGHRLGMGAGCYDRTFAFLQQRPGLWPRPRLLGIAFSFQWVEELPAEPWDVPLTGVVTERGISRCMLQNHRFK